MSTHTLNISNLLSACLNQSGDFNTRFDAAQNITNPHGKVERKMIADDLDFGLAILGRIELQLGSEILRDSRFTELKKPDDPNDPQSVSLANDRAWQYYLSTLNETEQAIAKALRTDKRALRTARAESEANSLDSQRSALFGSIRWHLNTKRDVSASESRGLLISLMTQDAVLSRDDTWSRFREGLTDMLVPKSQYTASEREEEKGRVNKLLWWSMGAED